MKISNSIKGKIYKRLSKIYFCKYCNKCNEGRKIYCDNKCKSNFAIRSYGDLSLYRRACKFNFNLNDYPTKYNFSLIEKYGWYKAKNRGDNLNGISRDHIMSIRYGFDNNVPSWIISHPANLELMRHNDNISKGKKTNITLDELLEKIDRW